MWVRMRVVHQALAKRAFSASVDVCSRNVGFEAGTVSHRINLAVNRSQDDVRKMGLVKMDVRFD